MNDKTIKTGAEKNSIADKQGNKALKRTNQNNPENMPKEVGGYADIGKPEPTRYGDWESNGRCTDF